MTNTHEVLALADKARASDYIDAYVRASGHSLAAVVHSLDDVRARLGLEALSGEDPAVLIVEAGAWDERAGFADALVSLAREEGVPVVWLQDDGHEAPEAFAHSEVVVASSAPRELGLAVSLAMAQWSAGRAQRTSRELGEALRQSEGRYESLFHDAPVFFWEEDVSAVDRHLAALRAEGVTDIAAYAKENPEAVMGWVLQNEVVNVNEAALREFGTDSVEDHRDSVGETLMPDIFPQIIAAVVAYAEGKLYWQFEGRYRNKKTGVPFVALCRFVFPRPGMTSRRMIMCGIDITERKRSEEEISELNRALSERAHELEAINHELEAFSYSVSHDLRAPLRAIEGFSRLLFDRYHDQLDERGQNYLTRVREAGQRMNLLIEDLLKLSRMSRSEMHLESCDLSAMAEETISNLRQISPEREVEVLIAPEVRAKGDPTLLRAVLENLLGNAWKFSAKREHARIEFGVTMESGRVSYFVRDNGAGFDMAYLGKLFNAFQRLHTATEFEGTGIGLATVQRIVRRHGGEVWAKGEIDVGATFGFSLG